MRDPEKPLLQLPRRHGGAAAPARAVDHLLVRENGIAARTPVHGRALAIRETALEHLQEDPLVPLVVVGKAGRDLPLPRIADPEPLELPFHVIDVFERPRLGMRAVLDGRVFRRQTERVPPERVEHVEPAHALHAGDYVPNHVVADVTHMRVAGRIGEHFQAVELRPGGILRDFECAAGVPSLAPLLLNRLGLVLGHDLLIISGRPSSAGASRGQRRHP